jgi:hypothetical protein
MEMVFPILQFLAGEAPGWTDIIQDKIAIWAARQLVKNESAVDFSNTTRRHELQGARRFCGSFIWLQWFPPREEVLKADE